MLIIPAIDLKDGHCVRLEQGRMDAATVFSKEPGKTAQTWTERGARRLHVVDLNGAVAGKPRNEETAAMAGALAVQGARPLAHNGYKIPLVRNLVKRAIRGEAQV